MSDSTATSQAPSDIPPAPLPTGFSEATVGVNGVQVHYVTGGAGEPLVLLHGFPQTWYEWHRIMPQLAERFTVVAPDLRGVGGSSKPPPEAGYDTGTLAEDLHALVRHLGFESIRLVGHDVGLMVAYAYAATYRNEVSKLVLLDAPIPGIEPAWSGVMAQLWHFRFHQVRDLPEQLIAGREREYLTWFYTAFSADPTTLAFTEAEVGEFVRGYAGAIGPSLETYRAFPASAEQNQAHARTKLAMPVLALGGEHAFGPQIVALAQQVADDVRGGSVPDAGHWIAEENPDFLLAQFLDFLP